MEFIKENNQISYIDDNGKVLAYITWKPLRDGVVNLNHTFVHSSLRGQGIAGKLMALAYEVLKEKNVKVVPTCSYAISWFDKNEDKKDILA